MKHKKYSIFHYEHWYSLRNFLQDAPLTDVFRLHIENYTTEVSSYVKAGRDAFVPSVKYQVKPQSFLWFKPECSVTIAHGKYYFRLYQHDSYHHNRRLFVAAHNKCKRFLE